jgi:predicted MPP superfamily phosphohydrolase
MSRVEIERFSVGRKLKNTTRLLLLSDLHMAGYYHKDLAEQVAKVINENHIKYVMIAGDITNFSNPKRRADLRNFLRKIAVVPVFLSLGNHDLYRLPETDHRFFNEFNKLKNVFPLDNKKRSLNRFDVVGFSPRHAVYRRSNLRPKGVDMFIEDWRAAGKLVSDSKPAVILCHDPQLIWRAITERKLPELTTPSRDLLILSGHMHNGYVSQGLERLIGSKLKDYGIWEYPFHPVVRLCRGQHNQGRAWLVVSKGVSKTYVLPHISHATIVDWSI